MDEDQIIAPGFENVEDGLKELADTPYERPVVDDPWRQLRLMHKLAADLLAQHGAMGYPVGEPTPHRSSIVEAKVVETVTRPVPALDLEDGSDGAEEGDADRARESLRHNYELVLSELGEGPNSAFTLSTGIRELGRRANRADREREMRDELARLDQMLEVESLRDEVVDAWHAGAFGDRDLRDVVHMEEDEYDAWVARGPRALEEARARYGDRRLEASMDEEPVESVADRLRELDCLDASQTTVHYLLGEIHELARRLTRRPSRRTS